MRKYIFPEKDDRYSITECSECGVVVFCGSVTPDKTYPNQLIYDDPCSYRHLAFKPLYRFSKTEAGPIGKCKCKTIPITILKQRFEAHKRELANLKERVATNRALCPHEEWWLIGKGDYRHSIPWKECVVCGRLLEKPTAEEIEGFLKAHPGYECNGHSVYASNDAEPFPETIGIGDPDE